MLPNFMLIGPGRAGTSWLTKSLSSHPEIFIPRRKSTRYFSSDYHMGLAWYESQFKGYAGQKAIGEASVGYLPNEDAPKRIHDLIPGVKLIATLRHPVDRAYSSYGRLAAMAKKGEPNYDISFEDKLKVTPRLLNEGYYARHLKHYMEYFPREQILILFFEDMNKDPEGYLRAIYEFLGVDPNFRAPLLDQRLNATSTLRPKSRLLYGIYRTMVRLSLFKWTKRLDDMNRREVPKLRPELRQQLLDQYYLDDIADLERLTSKDLSAWKSGPGR
jgi:hypothetical protein